MGELTKDFINKIYQTSRIAIGFADLNGKFLDVNEAFLKITGYSKKDLLVKRYQDITPEEFHGVDEQVVDQILNQDRAVEYEKEIICKDGSRVRLLLNSVCLRNEKGEPYAFAGTGQELTRDKSYQNEFQDYENKFLTLLDITTDIVCELNSRFHFLYASPNSADILSNKPSELIGRDLFDYIHQYDLFIIKSMFENSIRNFSSAYCVFKFRSKQGQWLSMECNIKPFKVSNGDIRLIMTLKNVSNKLALEEKVRKQGEELKKLDEYLEQRIRDLNILYTVTKAVHQSLDLKEVYKIALDMIIALDNVDMVFVYLVDKDRKVAVLDTYRNVPDSYIKRASRIPKGVGITWKIIDSGKFLNIEDIQYNKDIGPAGKELGHHGLLGIPLRIGKDVIGGIYFATYKNRKFDHNEVSLFSSISDHLSVAISKASLYAELRKKNIREKNIGAITRSVHKSINMKNVLRNAAESIRKNIDNADNVAIYMARDNEAVLNAYTGDEVISARLKEAFASDATGITWKILNEGMIILDNHVSPKSKFRIDFLILDSDIGSYLGIPIRLKKRVIGVISISSFKENAFDDREVGFFKIVTKQIESALLNARMAESLKESEKKYRYLYENVPTGIYCKAPDGRIIMANPTLVQMLGYQSFDEMASSNLRRNEFAIERTDNEFSKILKKWTVSTDLESTWLKRDGSIINVIESIRAVRDKSEQILYYEGTVTDITERKKAERILRKSRARLRRLTQHLQLYREEERAAIAREIHDEFAQLLTGMAVDLTWLKKRLPEIIYPESSSAVIDKIDNFSKLMNDAFEAVKKICAKLRPKILDDLGIEAAIRWQLDTVKAQTGIEYEFCACIGESFFDQQVSTVVFRILQESLTNIISHAQATKVTVNLKKEEKYLILNVKDDGKGITENSIFSMDSLGLLGIRERVHALKGDVRIKGVRGKGTTVRVKIPYEGKPA